MKVSRTHHLVATVLCLGTALALPGYGSQKNIDLLGRASVPAVESNSFRNVAAHLDPGGSFYLYMGAEQWLNGLSAKMAEWRAGVVSLPDNARERENLGRLFDLLQGLVQVSGLEELTAVGASGVEIEKGTYLNKVVLHHYPGRNQGLLWSMFGKEPHALTGLDYLPENTALGWVSDLDAALFWTTLKQAAQKAAIPELDRGLEEISRGIERQFGMSIEKLLGSLGGEVGFIMTLDPTRTMTIPRPRGPQIQLPELAIALLVKTKDETLFNTLDKLLEKNPQTVKSEKGGVKMRTMPLPMPFPLRPSVASSGDYLYVGSTDDIINNIIAAKNGRGKRLQSTAEFKEKSRGIPLEGNSFTYVSPAISRAIAHVVNSIADMQSAQGGRDERIEFLAKLLEKEDFSFTVASNTKEGWVMQSRSSQHPATAILGSVAVVPLAMTVATAAPAASRARGRAQTINCVNNLKQIGLAARMYANDHNEVMPKDFESMKAELNSPRVLICPLAQSKAKANDWAMFNFADATYQIMAPGASGNDDPRKVYVRCPLHGNECHLDGSVTQGSPQSQGGRRNRPRPQ